MGLFTLSAYNPPRFFYRSPFTIRQVLSMRIALGIEYDGSRYFGWQRQREVISVQAELEKALSRIANHPISIQCAGRTDAGVHATGQVIHFDTHAIRSESAWTLGLNSNLPPDIAVRWVLAVDETFHARFSATARRYRYVIYNHNYRPAILGSGVSHYHETIDAELMHQAGQSLLGNRISPRFGPLDASPRRRGAM